MHVVDGLFTWLLSRPLGVVRFRCGICRRDWHGCGDLSFLAGYRRDLQPMTPLSVGCVRSLKPVTPLLSEKSLKWGVVGRQWCRWLHECSVPTRQWCRWLHECSVATQQWCRRLHECTVATRQWCRRLHECTVPTRQWCRRLHECTVPTRQWCQRLRGWACWHVVDGVESRVSCRGIQTAWCSSHSMGALPPRMVRMRRWL